MSHAQAAASPAPAATPTENTVNLPKPECEIDYGQWMDNLTKEARDAGVGEKGIAELHKAMLEQKVLDRDRKQTVFNLTFTEFSKRLISEARLKKAAKIWPNMPMSSRRSKIPMAFRGQCLLPSGGLKPTMVPFRAISTR